jgi:hypothetical protein
MPPDNVSSEEEEHPSDRVDPESDFPALTITLEEARKRYQDEERRQNSVESKTSMLTGINVLIISLTTAFFEQNIFLIGIIILPALVSAYLGLRILQIRSYDRPAKNIDDFYQYAKQKPAEVEDTLLNSYIGTTSKNKSRNDEKVENFKTAYLLTMFSLTLIVITPVIRFLVDSYLSYIESLLIL